MPRSIDALIAVRSYFRKQVGYESFAETSHSSCDEQRILACTECSQREVRTSSGNYQQREENARGYTAGALDHDRDGRKKPPYFQVGGPLEYRYSRPDNPTDTAQQ